MLEWHNAATLSEYKRLNDERNNCNLHKFDMFCAFSDEQFAQNSKTIRPLQEGEKYATLGAGVFGTKDGIKRYLAYSEDIDRQIYQNTVRFDNGAFRVWQNPTHCQPLTRQVISKYRVQVVGSVYDLIKR